MKHLVATNLSHMEANVIGHWFAINVTMDAPGLSKYLTDFEVFDKYSFITKI